MYEGELHCFCMRKSHLCDTIIHVLFTWLAHAMLGGGGLILLLVQTNHGAALMTLQPGEELVLEGHQTLPSSHPGHSAFSAQHLPSSQAPPHPRSWASASLVASLTLFGLLLLRQCIHHLGSTRHWESMSGTLPGLFSSRRVEKGNITIDEECLKSQNDTFQA